MDNSRSIFRGRRLRDVFVFRLFFLVSCFLLASFAGTRAGELETWSRMVEGLKERQYFDTAIEYLHWMRSSSFRPSSLERQFDYQIGCIHLAAVEQQALFLKREEHVAECQKAFEKYLDENPDGELAFEAASALGRLWMGEGRLDMARAALDVTRDSERETLKTSAREAFLRALPFFERADKLATERARYLQNKSGENDTTVKEEDLNDAYAYFLAGKILINVVKSEIAKTFPPDDEEFKKRLTEVAENFSRLGSIYKNYYQGHQMRLYAARARRDLGDFKSARDILGELNVLRGDVFMDIRVESLILALEMNYEDRTPEWLADSVTRVREWNDSAPNASKLTQQGQQIYLLGAQSLMAYAETVKDKRADYNKAMNDAKIFLDRVRTTYPQYHRQAQEILRFIGGIVVDRDNPQTFDEAKDYVEEDWKLFIKAYQDWQDTRTSEELPKAKARLDEAGDTCIAAIQRAVDMREDGTPMVEINKIRANLARVYAVQGKILEAAILADYLVQRYPNDPDADKMAGLAVRFYRQVFVDDKRAGRETDIIDARLSALCAFIVEHWPGKEVIGEVQLLRIDTAIDSGRLDEAKEHLSKTPEGTPQRAAAELRIGQSLWNRYLAVSRLPEDADERPDKKTLDAMVDEARQQLESGLATKIALIESSEDSVNMLAVVSAMILGYICMNANDPQGTIDWMAHERVGPVHLMDAPSPDVVIDDKMKLDCTMVILRAYVSADKLDEAENIMDRLESLIKEQTTTNSADPDAERKLTQIYVTLGRQLENRLKELNEARDIEQAEAMAKNFEKFLLRIKGRDKKANSFQSLYWVADTFYRLGSGLTSEGQTASPDAVRFFTNAIQTFNDILNRIDDEEPGWAPERAEKTIDVRLAESLRCIGRYELAMRYLVADIDDDGKQIKAVKILKDWGVADLRGLKDLVVGLIRFIDSLADGASSVQEVPRQLKGLTNEDLESLKDDLEHLVVGRFERLVQKLIQDFENKDIEDKDATDVRRLRDILGDLKRSSSASLQSGFAKRFNDLNIEYLKDLDALVVGLGRILEDITAKTDGIAELQSVDALVRGIRESNRLDTQIEVAKTLAAWGSKDPEKNHFSIHGVRGRSFNQTWSNKQFERYASAVGRTFPPKPDDPEFGEPELWGWNGLISRTSSDVERFGDVYYNAHLGRLYCCLVVAENKKETDQEKIDKAIQDAMNGLLTVVDNRDMLLGGPEFYSQFDQIYRRIQRVQGVSRSDFRTLKKLQEERKPEDTVLTVSGEPTPELVPDSKKPADTSSSGMLMWVVLGGTAVLSVPLVYFFAIRKKKVAPPVGKKISISIP